MLYDGVNWYAYDNDGRLCATQSNPVNGGTVAFAYLYDAEGRRVAKGTIAASAVSASSPLKSSVCNPSIAVNNFTVTESYVLGQSGEQLTALAPGTSWTRTNVYGAGLPLATYDNDAQGAVALHFLLTDHLGSRRLQTDPAGTPETDCQSLPYGDALNCVPAPNAPATADDANPLHYTGKERDTESGLDYFGARYFGSNMGRFMSPDDGEDQHPTNPQSWNLYSYGRNNPLIGTDDDGNTYHVCDQNGQNCNDQSDAQFDQNRQNASADGERYSNGNITFADGTAAGSYKQTDVDIPGDAASNVAAFGQIGNQGMGAIKVFTVGSVVGAACVVGCPAAGAAALTIGRGLLMGGASLLPAVPSAIEKLQKLGVSISEANELIENPTTQKLIDNANGGNINYVADVGGKLVRITTDPTGQRIISAGMMRANQIANGIANGRFTK